MTYAVCYHSKTGNTKKMADAVASVVGVNASDVSSPLSERVDVLFLGSSTYAAGFDPSIGDFLKENAKKVGMIVFFGSSASGKSTAKKIKKLADELGIPMYKKSFSCLGHFLFMHKNNPDENDLEALRSFTKEVVSALG